MCSSLVHTCYQQPYTIGTFPEHLSGGLRAVTDLSDDPLNGDGTAIGHFRGERLAFHEIGEDAGIGGETGESETEV